MIPELFAAAATIGLLASIVANVRPWPVIIGLPSTITGFFMAELARLQMIVHTLAAAVWVAFGGLDEGIGWVAVARVLASVALLELAHRRGVAAAGVMADALPEHRGDPPDTPHLGVVRPTYPGVDIRRDVTYGPHPRNHADLYLPADPVGAPIVIQVHGGGWVSGNKTQQGQPLLSHFTRAGWIGVAINYRMGPRHRLPAAVHDVKQTIAWVRANAPEWGGDADRILLTGGSAGGHLTALCALTADDLTLQPGFEEADCSVAAAAPMYGVFDLTDRNTHRGRMAMTPFLERMVLGTTLADDPAGWEALSPVCRVRPDGPPMLIVSCAYDTLVPVEEARDFGRAMTDASPSAHSVELPHAHHAFDVINGPRAQGVIQAMERWASTVTAKGPVDA